MIEALNFGILIAYINKKAIKIFKKHKIYF